MQKGQPNHRLGTTPHASCLAQRSSTVKLADGRLGAIAPRDARMVEGAYQGPPGAGDVPRDRNTTCSAGATS